MLKSVEERALAYIRREEAKKRVSQKVNKMKRTIAEDVAIITPGVQPVAYHPTNRDNFEEVSTIMLRIVECWPVDLSQKFHRMYEKQRYHM